MTNKAFSFFEEPSGIIVVTTLGFWTLADADKFRDELTNHLNAARAKRGYALSLVDGRDNVVQSAEVMDHLSDIEGLTVKTDNDRSALIMPSSLAKMQAQRIMHSPRAKAFLSSDAARTWLLAYADVPTDFIQKQALHADLFAATCR